MLSDKEKKQRQHKKELKSFRNKMGSNIVWFDSLPLAKKYDLLFEWKSEKHNNTLKSPETKKVKRRNPYLRKWEYLDVVSYPVNFKYFILVRKNSRRYKPSVVSLRDTTIDILLNKKTNK